ncbi:uncharacterized protein LOC117651562 [Thrips palmi]|uniref:Uncharacterized protein LOC117651562 n=1 Tax=Thrips palmi TaxID=161013 RepID=A0A6P9A2W3_THRPL|nr:uncharacterized protein LOC117651562 [Thrips palmi]
MQALGSPFPTPKYARFLNVFVHADEPRRGRRPRWLHYRGFRVHVWLGDPEDGLGYLRALWRVAGLVNVLMLLPAGDGGVLVYSVYPYGVPGQREGPCNSDAPVLVDEWVPDASGGGGGGAFRHGRDLFPRDKLRDLRGCNLTVHVNTDYPFMMLETDPSTGQEVLEGSLKDVFRVMRQRLNFHAVLHTAENATATCESRLGDSLRHAHLAFTMSIRSVTDGPVWYDDSPMVVCLVWCVPIKSVSALSLKDYLSSGTWSVIGLSFVATGLAMALLHRPGLDRLGGLWGAWALLCGPLLQQPVAFNRRRGGTQVRTLALRAVVAHWGLAAVVLVAVVGGSAKSASMTSRSQPLMHSVRELLRSSLALQGSVGVVDMLRRAMDGADGEGDDAEQLMERLRVCDTHLNEALRRVAIDHDAAVLTVDLRCADYNRRNPSAGLHVFRDQCLRPSTLHLFTAPRWSPYVERVSEVSVRLYEAGLVQRALQTPHLSLQPCATCATTVRWSALHIEAVAPPLCILYAGLLVALVVLAAEVAWAKGLAKGSHRQQQLAARQTTLARKYSVHKDEVHEACQPLVAEQLSEQEITRKPETC